MRVPAEVYRIAGTPPHFTGFDILHDPSVDDQECDLDENEQCHRIEHLSPVAPLEPQ